MPYTVASPRPRPRPGSLVVKNGSKMDGQRRRVDPGARVPHRQHDVVPRRKLGAGPGIEVGDVLVRRGDGEPPAVRHRVARVHHQVHDHLLQVAGVGTHHPDRGREHRHQRQIVADQRRQQPDQVADQPVQVHRPGFGRVAAAEGEDLPGESRRPLRRLADLLQTFALGIAGPEVAQQEAGVALDRGEQIVEVVGHPRPRSGRAPPSAGLGPAPAPAARGRRCRGPSARSAPAPDQLLRRVGDRLDAAPAPVHVQQPEGDRLPRLRSARRRAAGGEHRFAIVGVKELPPAAAGPSAPSASRETGAARGSTKPICQSASSVTIRSAECSSRSPNQSCRSWYIAPRVLSLRRHLGDRVGHDAEIVVPPDPRPSLQVARRHAAGGRDEPLASPGPAALQPEPGGEADRQEPQDARRCKWLRSRRLFQFRPAHSSLSRTSETG